MERAGLCVIGVKGCLDLAILMDCYGLQQRIRPKWTLCRGLTVSSLESRLLNIERSRGIYLLEKRGGLRDVR